MKIMKRFFPRAFPSSGVELQGTSPVYTCRSSLFHRGNAAGCVFRDVVDDDDDERDGGRTCLRGLPKHGACKRIPSNSVHVSRTPPAELASRTYVAPLQKRTRGRESERERRGGIQTGIAAEKRTLSVLSSALSLGRTGRG